MKKQEQLAKAKAKAMLSQTLRTIPDSFNLSETKSYIKRAIESLDKQTKNEEKRNAPTNHQDWWGKIQAGAANMAASPMTGEGHMRSLAALNKMIEQTQSELDELEKGKQTQKPQQPEVATMFLQD